jgi:hypothetical protein
MGDDLPHPCRAVMAAASSCRKRHLRASELLVGEAITGDVAQRASAAVAIDGLARIEAERLLIEVAEELEGFDADVRAVDRPVQEAPEVHQPVGVYDAIDVCLEVVDDSVNVIVGEVVKRGERIGENFTTGRDLAPDLPSLVLCQVPYLRRT